MIAQRAVLQINHSTYEILRCYYQFQRDTDAKNRPCSVYYGGSIVVELGFADDNTLFRRMVDKKMTPVSGAIEVFSGVGNRCIRRIAFEQAYIAAYGENTRVGHFAPVTVVVISPMRLDFDQHSLRLDRRWPQAPDGWQRYEEEKMPFAPVAEAPPVPLVTAVKGEASATPHAVVEYRVTGYSLSGISESDKQRVKWQVGVDGKETLQKAQGETLKLTMEPSWAGKEIVVMPYLKKPTESVSVKTKVRIEAVVIFVNGYWNTGKSDTLLEPVKTYIAESLIGTENKDAYWGDNFAANANAYFRRKNKQWTSKEIENITSLYIDGSHVWNSSGETRFNAGWDEAETMLQKELIAKKVINADGKQVKKIFFVSHSMGAAHAEGMIAAWVHRGLDIEHVLHFSAADNRDFQVKLPRCTYQVNLVPDPVLMQKNTDDVAKTAWENFRNMLKRPYLDRPDIYMIERMLPANYIEVRNWDCLNHAYTKWEQVWNMVDFLKQ